MVGAMRSFLGSFVAACQRWSLLGCVLLLAAAPVHAEIDVAILERAEALINEGKADEAYLLLEPHEMGNAGDLYYDALLAKAAVLSKRPSRATFIYERILAVQPDYHGIRYDLGVAYFELGDYARVIIEMGTVVAVPDLPPDLKGSAEKYLDSARAQTEGQKTVTNLYVELSWGLDTNISGATGARSVFVPGVPGTLDLVPPDTETQDHYSGIALGGELTHELTKTWGVFVGGDLRGRRYRVFDQVNNWSGDGRLGFNYAGGQWLLRGTANAGQYTQDSDRLRDSVGLALDWRYRATESSQLSLNLGQTRFTYVSAANKANDNDTLSGSIAWLQAVGDGTTLVSISYSGGTESVRTTRVDGDRSFGGPRFLVQKAIDDKVGVFLTGGATFSEYDRFNDAFLVTRDETLYDAAMGVTFALKKGVALRPQVTYVRNKSNIALFDSQRRDFSMNLRFDL